MSAVEQIKSEVLDYLERDHRLFIDNEWVAPRSGKSFDVINPATASVIASVAEAGPDDVDAAVAAARRAFDHGPWGSMPPSQRGCIIWRLSELVDKYADDLIQLEVLDNGMPIAFAEHLMRYSVDWLRYYAGLTDKVFGKNASGIMSGNGSFTHAYSSSQPVGVAGLITPWNGPLGSLIIKLAPALAAGCAVVIKPAENTPLTTLRLGELIAEAGFPPGVVNILTGFGPVAGAALAEHSDVDKISFTGSTEVGKQIVKAATGNLKRVTLELGGKSPCIVMDDAKLETAIPGAAMAIFANTGQVCFAGSRLFVHSKVYDEVVAGIADFAKGMKVGSGFDRDNALGPLISEKQLERVSSYVTAGRMAGAEIVTGGGKVECDNGFFVEPTVFANVSADMRIVKEEIFGPVLCVTPFDDTEAVIQQANDTRYGLGAGIFSRSVDKIHYIASRLQTGNVWVNSYGTVHPALPFGGFKESGWGREMGTEGMDAYLEKKSVFISLDV